MKMGNIIPLLVALIFDSAFANSLALEAEQSGLTFSKDRAIIGLMAHADTENLEQRTYSWEEGMIAGENAAQYRKVGDLFLDGIIVGGLTGIIGTVVVWYLEEGDQIPYRLVVKNVHKGPEYLKGFSKAYKKHTYRKKLFARFGGSCLASAAWLVVYFKYIAD